MSFMDPALATLHAQRVELERRLIRLREQRKFFRMFPDEDVMGLDPETGQPVVEIHAREKYPKHLEFMAAGALYPERCFMAGNRVGKTTTGAYEVSCHLTGRYPHWWEGKRFRKPTRIWAAGKTSQTTRDIVQKELVGEIEGSGSTKHPSGTGMIPGFDLATWSWKSGTADFLDTVRVRHVSGGLSALGFKTYEQGRGSFEGTAQHVIWFDEEPDEGSYEEALMRTATTNGIAFITFTPLAGLSKVVAGFMPKELQAGSVE